MNAARGQQIDLEQLNARYVWHPMADPKFSEAEPPLIVARGQGMHVFDHTGRQYLDCTAGMWNVNVGYGHPEVKNAIVEQLDQLAYYGTFAGTSNPPSIALSQRLVDMLRPERMARVLFSSGGSDANETAIKLARQYWKLMGCAGKTKVFSMRNGYHGVHFGGMSAAGDAKWRRPYEPLLPGFVQVDSIDLYRNPYGLTDHEELGRRVAEQLDREIRFQGPDTVAAFIAEPVQGAGGVYVPPAGFWPAIRRVCDDHQVLLIADEVVTGFGRTGDMFGCRGWGVAPDIMALAKGINSGYVPLGATVVNERVASAWSRQHELATITTGYTYSGHPLACAAALANLDIVERDDLPRNAALQGAYFLERLQELLEYPLVGDVRGKGLMLAAELVLDKRTREPLGMFHPTSRKLLHAALAEGLLVRISGNKIFLSPPLVIERAHVDQAMDALHTAFRKVVER